MRLFDPPVVKIRKRLPRSTQTQYDEFVQFAQSLVPADLNKKQEELALGFIAAAWVASENREGHLPLDSHTRNLVAQTVDKCRQRLGSREDAALGMAEKLMQAGYIKV